MVKMKVTYEMGKQDQSVNI